MHSQSPRESLDVQLPCLARIVFSDEISITAWCSFSNVSLKNLFALFDPLPHGVLDRASFRVRSLQHMFFFPEDNLGSTTASKRIQNWKTKVCWVMIRATRQEVNRWELIIWKALLIVFSADCIWVALTFRLRWDIDRRSVWATSVEPDFDSIIGSKMLSLKNCELELPNWFVL